MNAYGYPGIDGFLGTRAPLIMDVLCVAMLVVLIVLGWSVYQVKYHRRYTLHKWTQIVLATILLIVVILFEADVRIHGWQERSAGQLGGHASAAALTTLYVHLVFAISTTLLWPVTIVLALRNFANPAMPGPHSRIHVPLARIAALDMVITSFTGWIFYWVAFVR
jgi:membrane-associated HD superfamily phosphohydrolase